MDLPALDPIAGTEAMAYDFLAKGGKHSRPFITLAVYDALTGGRDRSQTVAEHRRVASRRRPPHRHVDRDVPQGVAGSRRHRRRRPVPLRRGDAAPQVRRADGNQRWRLPDRDGLPAGQSAKRPHVGRRSRRRHLDCLADAHSGCPKARGPS